MKMAEEVYSDFMKEIKEGRFVWTGELEPAKDIGEAIEAASELKGLVTACNVTDNPQSFTAISSLAASYKIQEETGMECIYQLRCSDRNRMALCSDVMGAGILGLKNILTLTGDYVSLGVAPMAKPVFDLDSTTLTRMIYTLVHEGKDVAGTEIPNPPKLHVGAAAGPGMDPLEPELYKLKRKAIAGAEFFQTQVVYLSETIDRFFKGVKDLNIETPILVGIFPAKTYGAAKFFDENVTGVDVPPDFLKNLEATKQIKDKEKRKEEVDRVNIEYFTGFLEHLKGTPAVGCHIMAVGYPRIIPELKKIIE
jgi:5,10-methylenetetrahydrofolate reductase